VKFHEAASYLFSLGNEVEAMKLGLDNIRTLLSELGDPQQNYLKVQVAGTNGKGSVCAFLDSICREAGIRTGLYTSPHLVSITERVRIDGVDISAPEFARIAALVRETAEKLLADGRLEYRPTFFEQMTAIALVAFADAKVELAILETGLGGRLDATTAANAEIAAITSIGLDHREYLGDTIEQIAAEKAAIIRNDTEAVVIGRQKPRVLTVIWDRLRDMSPPRPSIRECAVVFDESALGNPIRKLPSETGLRGMHQIENAEVAVLLADILRKYFPITDDAIRHGLKSANHPGRLEYIGNFLLDGAHNPAGATALRKFLDEFEERPITMVFGSMKEKDIREIADILWPLAAQLILTRPSNSRAFSAEELSEYLPAASDPARVQITDSVEDAIRIACEITPSNAVILVTGSLYLVGEAKKLLNN
jgi:dihydrofolate synthase / folylpolyglutamate synthase